MMRYTKKGDAILDPFAGSGTTLIEAQRLGRHALGVELQPAVAELARSRVAQEPNEDRASIKVINEDCRSARTRIWALNFLKDLNRTHFQAAILHPPYHDIIKFSDNPDDLSNAGTVDQFLTMFDEVLDLTVSLLEPGRYLTLVIGDKYDGGEWIPLGFYTMQHAAAKGMTIKSVIVKNMAGSRAKRNVENLWRYRALYGGFYVFRHEYVIVLKKN
jgi:DNA modification methylase